MSGPSMNSADNLERADQVEEEAKKLERKSTAAKVLEKEACKNLDKIKELRQFTQQKLKKPRVSPM